MGKRQAAVVGVFLGLLPNLDPPTRPAGFSLRHSFPLLRAPCSRPSERNAGQVGSTASLTVPLQPYATAPSDDRGTLVCVAATAKEARRKYSEHKRVGVKNLDG